jgi:hypothetical protein
MAWQIPLAIVASSVIGANAQSKAAKAAANAAKGKERDYLKEMRTALDAQEAIQPDLLRLERQYRPEWQQLEADMLRQQVGLSRSIQDEMIAGSGARGLDALREASPMYSYAGQEAMSRYMDMMSPQARSMYEATQQKALEEYGLGRNLSPEEERQVSQSARQAMQSRGLQSGAQAAALEALMLNDMANRREEVRRMNALAAIQASETQAGNAWNLYGAPLMQQANFVNPAMALGLAQQMQASAGPQTFQPESQYSAGVYGANTQNAVSSALAAAQSKAAMGAGLMSMAGNIGAGYYSNPGLHVGQAQPATAAYTPMTAPQMGVYNQGIQNSQNFWANPYFG